MEILDDTMEQDNQEGEWKKEMKKEKSKTKFLSSKKENAMTKTRPSNSLSKGQTSVTKLDKSKRKHDIEEESNIKKRRKGEHESPQPTSSSTSEEKVELYDTNVKKIISNEEHI